MKKILWIEKHRYTKSIRVCSVEIYLISHRNQTLYPHRMETERMIKWSSQRYQTRTLSLSLSLSSIWNEKPTQTSCINDCGINDNKSNNKNIISKLLIWDCYFGKIQFFFEMSRNPIFRIFVHTTRERKQISMYIQNFIIDVNEYFSISE